MHYEVLKEWNDHKVGEVINLDALSTEEVASLVADGIVAEVKDIPLSGVTVDYTIDQAWLDLNPGADFKVGDVIQAPVEAVETAKEGDSCTLADGSKGVLKLEGDKLVGIPAEEKAPESFVSNENDAQAAADTSSDSAEVELSYRGQRVISNGTREVEGVQYHHIRIADGSTYDLSDEDYEREVKPTE